ncbi:hypothetical protein LCGC14_1137430 [marine sediment metagenome]|uniref:Uncharacterized protein n=1 Tax=marine sediment metagenome TaxID=412755 RepID=A0A0F9PHH0_9ZZZZ
MVETLKKICPDCKAKYPMEMEVGPCHECGGEIIVETVKTKKSKN